MEPLYRVIKPALKTPLCFIFAVIYLLIINAMLLLGEIGVASFFCALVAGYVSVTWVTLSGRGGNSSMRIKFP